MRRFTLLILIGYCGIFAPLSSFSQKGVDQLIQQLKKQHFEGVISSNIFLPCFMKKSGLITAFEERHNYLWYKNDLHYQIEATGKVFKVVKAEKIQRIDSTYFEGYNNYAFHFVYNDTIFAIGGYGFWHISGLLRFFDDKTGSWNVLPTNISVPIMLYHNSQAYYDLKNHKVFFIFQKAASIENLTDQRDLTFYVQCLDLKTKTWWSNPKLLYQNTIIPEKFYYYPIPFHSQNGMLIRNDLSLLLLDFSNNIQFEINPNKSSEINSKLLANSNSLTFSMNHTLYFYYPKSGLIDSVLLTPDDLINTHKPVYTELSIIKKLHSDTNTLLTIIGAFLLVGFLTAAVVKIYQLNKKVAFLKGTQLQTAGKKILSEINIGNTNSFRQNITEVEKSLLDLLIANTSKNEMTTVTQMNQVLGIANKDTKIQNNIRSNTIQSINKKFNLYSALPDELIEKQRTEFDKRFFEYQIQRKYLNKVKGQK